MNNKRKMKKKKDAFNFLSLTLNSSLGQAERSFRQETKAGLDDSEVLSNPDLCPRKADSWALQLFKCSPECHSLNPQEIF
jgi:hypothetical protein